LSGASVSRARTGTPPIIEMAEAGGGGLRPDAIVRHAEPAEVKPAQREEVKVGRSVSRRASRELAAGAAEV
jgi:hypothetical protein